ncbi:MAG: dephospho-CoA kinase [Lachnospiraceae bacterium]|nr:dephospho-CoA kinase [Lachnospiraceae bacterium]
MHITLTGNLGSGKSTISRIFKDKFNYEIYSTGRVIRELAEERGITVLEMNKLMSEDNRYDHMIDDKSAQISRERQDDDIFYDSRLAWHFVGKAFRVFLSVSLDTSVKRIMGDNRGSVESFKSYDECKASIVARVEEEERRYREIYGIDYFDYTNYNLVLDSSCCPPEVLAQILYDEAVEYYKAMDEGRDYTRLIISTERGLGDFEEECQMAGVDPEVKSYDGYEFLVLSIEK